MAYMVRTVLAHWNLEDAKTDRIHDSTWEIGEQYILKAGNDYIGVEDTYFMLTTKLEGEHLADIYANDYKNSAYLLGIISARLHRTFAEIQHTLPCYDNDYSSEISGWVSETLLDHTNYLLPSEHINSCSKELAHIYPALPRQLIHRDLHLENLLFKGDKLTGYIDFDLGQINARIFDICYLALSFLIGNYEDKQKSTQWFEILEQLIKGYNSELPLSQLEKDVIPIMMLSIELLFVAHFTKENNPILAKSAASMFMWLRDNRNSIFA